MHKKLAAVFILFFIIACVVSVPANCKIPRLQACQKIDSDRPPDDPFPKDYQIAIKAHLRETLNDPYSIRDLKISVPEPTKIPLDDSTKGYAYFWASCISYNAKNLYGAYTGIHDILWYLQKPSRDTLRFWINFGTVMQVLYL
jgi:hypothetical protein